ncbi:MAG: FAD-dependent oxidoreductase, partial [Muribaculaceae bacterium]|nr:FAD-dependent oxidoreductase [Muribaculaceae bacterium]
VFEPSVAERILLEYIDSADLDVKYGSRLNSVKVSDGKISEIVLETADGQINRIVRAKEYIDCTYEGDLMAGAGVSYTVGREGNEVYGEQYNGVQVMRNHQFHTPVDPYVEPGNPASGLLWGIRPGGVESAGTGDNKVQAYCFRVCLTDSMDNMIPITKPDNYDPSHYELLARLIKTVENPRLDNFFIWSHMPGAKTDINNRGAFSTDMIGANWDYPDASYERRAEIWRAHEDYTKGLFYFMGHDLRVPESVRTEMLRWGYPKDEYIDNDHWTHQLYVREARRMIGSTVMTEAHCLGQQEVNDPIGWAAYTMDSHNCNRTIIGGLLKNEGNVEVGGFPPFPISYGAIVPKADEIRNLLVPVCLSASHIAYGSIRMEPVFMVLAQVSAIAASDAIDRKCDIQLVDALKVASVMEENPLLDNSVPETVVDNSAEHYVTLTGNWTLVNDSKRSYGRDYYMCTDDSENSCVCFQPILKKTGDYDVYMYVPRVKGLSTVISVEIYDGQSVHHTSVHTSATAVLGQAYGEWVHLGSYNLLNGSNLKIKGTGTSGVAVADAILFLPRK